MNVEEFARQVAINRSTGKAALIIGFDGGAALLRHSRPEAMIAALQDDARGPLVRDPDSLWKGQPTTTARRKFLETHTRTNDISPDSRALHCIAGLLGRGYIRAIVATDTSRGLSGYLRGRISMEEFDSGTRPEKLKAIGNNLGEKPAFIDGAELLLYGFNDSIYGLYQNMVNETRRALKEFLSGFDHILCWGWSDRNVYLNTICDHEKVAHLYLLGSYSQCVSSRWDGVYDLVEDPSDRSEATTDIILKICSRLPGLEEESWRSDPVTAMPSEAPTAAYGEQPVAMASPQRLLWPAEVLDNLMDRTSGPRISVTGVDGELVRSGLAQWLLSSLRQRGREWQYLRASDLVSLGGHITMLTDTEAGICVVGELSDRVGDEHEWGSPLATYILRWGYTKAAPDQHVALFVPATVAQWASRAYAGQDYIYVHTLDTAKCLVLEQVAEWLVTTLMPLLDIDDLDDADVRSLASQMVKDALARGRDAADWLHQALAIWEQLVRRELGEHYDAHDETAQDADHEFGIDELAALWETLVERYRHLEEEAAPGFDFGEIQPHKTEVPDTASGTDAAPDLGSDSEPSASDDFDLGPIAPKAPGTPGRPAK